MSLRQASNITLSEINSVGPPSQRNHLSRFHDLLPLFSSFMESVFRPRTDPFFYRSPFSSLDLVRDGHGSLLCLSFCTVRQNRQEQWRLQQWGPQLTPQENWPASFGPRWKPRRPARQWIHQDPWRSSWAITLKKETGDACNSVNCFRPSCLLW